ncbi:hypothetical protein AaE_003629 [Aphanomyces astaci]|uniref:Uncharacterized protein n=1 Tax=Aphanomyces astaci TaxID=112090 RepID=A0A6A5ARS3_APHAT|nr:hypothetical protein AaE_003629 [Aphanomyces astaci]
MDRVVGRKAGGRLNRGVVSDENRVLSEKCLPGRGWRVPFGVGLGVVRSQHIERGVAQGEKGGPKLCREPPIAVRNDGAGKAESAENIVEKEASGVHVAQRVSDGDGDDVFRRAVDANHMLVLPRTSYGKPNMISILTDDQSSSGLGNGWRGARVEDVILVCWQASQ